MRPLEADHLPFAASLHHRTLPHGFFARLGPEFLRAYHRGFVESPHAVARLALRDGVPVGVAVGPTRTATHRAWVVRHHGRALATAGLVALLARPTLLAVFVRTRLLHYLRGLGRLLTRSRALPRGKGPSTADPSGPVGVLMHLAVAPDERGAGTGRALVRAFCGAVAATGTSQVRLVTLAGPRGAAGFYRDLGWEEAGRRHDRDGRRIIELRRSLGAPARS